MDSRTRKRIEQFVNENIQSFHKKRVENLHGLTLDKLVKKKNPYLFRAKDINLASDFVAALLGAHLSSGEESSFGGFLEDLALFVAEITCDGKKSSSAGIDIDLTKDGVRYLIAVKSGNNWGNSSQYKALKSDFRDAVKVLKQSKRIGEIQPTLGISYGKMATKNNGLYLKVSGQSFWHLISDDPELYTDIVEPLGYEAEEHNKKFVEEIGNTTNRMVREFTNKFCDEITGKIEWPKLVRFVSKNMKEA